MDPLWAELINSDWRDYRGGGGREDRIENRAWLARFVARCGALPGWLPDPSGREQLHRLREVLTRAAMALMAGETLAEEDLTTLNAHLAGAPVARRIARDEGGFSATLLPIAEGIARVMGEIATSFAGLLATGDPTRIKVCANPDCGWVIYDESRSRTRRWCDSTECGNLLKVRRFRQRHRHASPSTRVRQRPPRG